MPSTSLYWHTFGSLATALREAGFDVAVGEERLERAVAQGGELARRLGRLPKFGDWQAARRADPSLLTEWQVYRMFEAPQGRLGDVPVPGARAARRGGRPRRGRRDGRLSPQGRSSARPGAARHDQAMSTSTDTFARFVDVLAETLDDHATCGQALASRLHLSRFHFDRLVSAACRRAAGDAAPPRAPRAWLAYRLITTSDDVLAVCARGGLLVARGVHARVRSCLRRCAVAVASRDRRGSRSKRRARCTSILRVACGCPPNERSQPWIC